MAGALPEIDPENFAFVAPRIELRSKKVGRSLHRLPWRPVPAIPSGATRPSPGLAVGGRLGVSGNWARVVGLAEKGGGPAVCKPTVICEVVAS